jgi:hypothetical protein
VSRASTLDLKQATDRVLVSMESDRETARLAVVEALRLVWNTRGAVDIALVERELSAMMGSNAALLQEPRPRLAAAGPPPALAHLLYSVCAASSRR